MKLVVNFLLLCLLVGCATQNNMEGFPVNFPKSTTVSYRHRPLNIELRNLTLDKAFQLAGQSNPDLGIAFAEIEEAKGRILQAGLFINPLLVATIESFSSKNRDNVNILTGISQKIPIGGRISKAKHVEEMELERLVNLFEAKKLEIRSKVHGAFAAALYSEQLIKALKNAIELTEQGVKITKSKFKEGDAIAEDVARAELESLKLSLEFKHANSSKDQAFEALKAAIGDMSLKIESVEGNLEAVIDVPNLEQLVLRLSESPFVTSAEADVKVQQARLELAKAASVPDIDIGLFYRRLKEPGLNTFDLGTSINLPIFDRAQGKIQELQQHIIESQHRVKLTKNELVLKIKDAHIRLVCTLGEAKILRDEIIPKSDVILKSAKSRYNQGEISLTDTLSAGRERIAVELNYLEKLRDTLHAWSELAYLLK